MKSLHIIAIMMIALVAFTACTLTETDDTSEDPEAAQSFFPNLDAQGYNVSSSDTVIDAVTTAFSGAALGVGNFAAVALIQKVDNMISCYQNVGAADAQIYTERLSIDSPDVPIGGVLMVVNEDRIANNFLHCLTQVPGGDLFESQRATPEPCWGHGRFTFNGDQISYLFAATDQPLCDLFDDNFAQYSPEGETSPIFGAESSSEDDLNP